MKFIPFCCDIFLFCFFCLSSLEVVKRNGKLIPQVVKLWVEQYEKDPKPAMVELLTMLFEVNAHLVLSNLKHGYFLM